MLVEVQLRSEHCSNTPATIDINFQEAMAGVSGKFDEHTVEVVPLQRANVRRVLHRLELFFSSSLTRLHFLVPSKDCTNFAVYFDTVNSGRGQPRRYPGLVGDGDYFREEFGPREIGVSHFDCLADLDRDGDLDLFKGGVEPFVYCYENVGQNHFVERGRLTSGGAVFKLPCSRDNRSWVTVAFYDLDGDGDEDFFPSFGDGPDAGKIIFYRNTGGITFERVGALQTTSGTLLAGGRQAGGWFPSIAFVRAWDGSNSNRLDAMVGSNHRCWLYRGSDGPVFHEPVALEAASKAINLVNPRFDVSDVDNDGDLDLLAGTQPGPVYLFQNTGSRYQPVLAAGKVIAWDGKYLIGDAHSGVSTADLNGDGLTDILSGRFWERTDLRRPEKEREFGGFYRNTGNQGLVRSAGPFTRQHQICDAVRQNSVRAFDWNRDGKMDLLAPDTDGFIWLFRNRGDPFFPVFEAGEKLRSGRQLLSMADQGGHARVDVCDWNNDGRVNLVVASGDGSISLFPDRGARQQLSASGKPMKVGGRASVLVCDWNNDKRKDLVLADDGGYYFCKNVGSDSVPLLDDPKPILPGGKKPSYVRPNLGSFVDWDGDGKKDLIGCHFENSIRFYRNVGSGAPGEEPKFSNPEGTVILKGESPQMISGADVMDWNGDGDLDILTGQGHGGSGLRFYERDWIENEMKGTHPVVTISSIAERGGKRLSSRPRP